MELICRPIWSAAIKRFVMVNDSGFTSKKYVFYSVSFPWGPIFVVFCGAFLFVVSVLSHALRTNILFAIGFRYLSLQHDE